MPESFFLPVFYDIMRQIKNNWRRIMTEQTFAQELIDFCYASPTSFHAVETAKEILIKNKFIELSESQPWKLTKAKRYFFVRNNSALIAFVTGSKSPTETGFKIVGSHTDSPCFRIKPSPEIVQERLYLSLNTEIYGSPILTTWFDRPLAIAGRVALKSKKALSPEIRLVNIKKPIAVIPNLAIHMNREVNDGYKPDKQKDVLPVIAVLNEKLSQDNFLLKLIASELKVNHTDILDFDLFLYEFEKGCITGANNEFISASRIDNLESVHAGLISLIDSKPTSTCVLACFDNEEVGSSSQTGANSEILASTLERITQAFKGNRESYYIALAQSFIISLDGAHATHPNFLASSDPTNKPLINQGPVIKISANKNYTTDAFSSACFEQICKNAKVPTQKFVNRSDMRGGSTIGPLSSTRVSINSIDIGIAMLAMHSIRELAGTKDHHLMYRALKEFFNTN